jgi:hypothetical protein
MCQQQQQQTEASTPAALLPLPLLLLLLSRHQTPQHRLVQPVGCQLLTLPLPLL